MMQNWNKDVKKIEAEQEALKAKIKFTYLGHGTKATGFMSKEFKRKAGLYARCTTCGYYMPLDARGSEDCICGNLHRDEKTFQHEMAATEIEIFKGAAK